MHLGNIECRLDPNYHLKYCWPKVIYCKCQPNELEREIKKKLVGANRGPTKYLVGHGPPSPPQNRHWPWVVKIRGERFARGRGYDNDIIFLK